MSFLGDVISGIVGNETVDKQADAMVDATKRSNQIQAPNIQAGWNALGMQGSLLGMPTLVPQQAVNQALMATGGGQDVWGLIANIAGNTLSLKRTSGDFVNVRIGAGTNNPGAVVFSASGGSGGYTYSHVLLPQSPSTPVITLTSTTGDTTAVTATSSPTNEVRAAVVTTVTDSDGNTAQLTYPVYLAWET